MLASLPADGKVNVFYPGGHGPLWDLAEPFVAAGAISKSVNVNLPALSRD